MPTKKILITGADGFIGSHLTEELVRMGHNVKALVLYNSFNSWGWLDRTEKSIKDSLQVISGDVRDPNSVKQAMTGVDVVLHLAALIAIPYSYAAPDSYIDTNIKGTLNILNAARELNVSKVVSTSTSEVYGTARYVPITEEHPLQGQSPYSATKIGADQLALSFHKSFNMPVAVIRPFNTYGPRQSARAIIPTIITQIASGKKKIRLGSLAPTRDFSFVKDIVRGFIAIMESERSIGEVINVGSNFEISVGETARIISEVMDAPIQIEGDETRVRPQNSEVERLWADNSKARKLVGWEPVYGGLEGFKKGLTETVEWFTRSENLVSYKHDVYNV